MATLSRMSGLGQDRARQNAAICAVLGMTAMITFPAMIYLTFGLNYPVSALLSPHWREVLPLIAILAPAGAAQSIAAYSGPILLARGEARLQFWISSANSAAMILAFVVALPFGLTAVAVVYTIVAIMVCVAMLIVGTRRAGLPLASVAKSLVPASVATLAAAAVALGAVSGEIATLKQLAARDRAVCDGRAGLLRRVPASYPRKPAVAAGRPDDASCRHWSRVRHHDRDRTEIA